MHEVKVYDGFGNLKKIISVKQLCIREDEQSSSPSLFRRDKRIGKPWAKTPKGLAKTGTQ
jgi:hypothetical protein